MVDIVERQQIWKDLGGNLTEKAAELANTYDMPSQSAPSKVHDKGKDKATIDKTGAAFNAPTPFPTEDDILKEAFGAQNELPTNASGGKPDDNEEHSMPEQPADVPQGKALKPRVDVSGKEPPKVVTQKTAELYALPDQQRYPLDSYDEVEKAAAYFDKWHKRMSPEMRREYCQNMVKRASVLSIPVSELAKRYGSHHWAPAEQIKIALDARRSVLADAMDPLHEDEVHETNHIGILNKLAEQQRLMTPDDFAVTLGEFDKLAGLNHYYDGDIPDPYFSCLAKHATSENDVDPDKTLIVGNEILPARKLMLFAHMSPTLIKERFGEEFAGELEKDPIGIFDSLPRDQKLVLLRMASMVEQPRQGASVG
jgi:hypothetical protein